MKYNKENKITQFKLNCYSLIKFIQFNVTWYDLLVYSFNQKCINGFIQRTVNSHHQNEQTTVLLPIGQRLNCLEKPLKGRQFVLHACVNID